MTNQPNILVRRSDNESTVWLNENYLLQLLPLLNKIYLDCKARPQYKQSVLPCYRNRNFLPATGKSWRWGKSNGTFYYEYDSIPNKAPTQYLSQLPSRNRLIEMATEQQKEQAASPLESFIKEFVNDNYKIYYPYYGYGTRQQQENLSKAAAFIDASIAWIKSKETNIQNSNLFKELSNILRTAGASYLPSNYRNLKKYIDEAIQGIPSTELVKLKRAGNQNASVHYNDEEIKSWILNMRYSGKNFTNAHIIRKVQWLCLVSEKPKPSDRWIGMQMEEVNNKFLTSEGRYGAKGKFNNIYRSSTPFANALYAGDCWQLDGTRINLTNFKQKITITDENGNERTVNKETFITIVAVRDVHSGDILGWSFNMAENRWTYIEALKAAVEETGYLPYEIVFDKFPGHNTPEFQQFISDLENKGVKVTFTVKAQGKGKIERFFGTLQSVFMQESDYYYGEGIQSRNKYAHRSKEYLKTLRRKANDEGWNWDAVCYEANKIITAYRITKLSTYSRKYKSIEQSPIEIHNASEKPNIIKIDKSQFVYLFGIRKTLRMTNMGLINFEMQGVTFNYRCADYDVVSKYDRVQICYTLDDMSCIHLYEVSETPVRRYLGIASEIPDIVPYGPDAFNGFGRQQAIIKQLEDFRSQELEYKKAVGFDSMAILEQGQVSKGTYDNADAAATMQLLTGNTKEEEGNIDGFDIRDNY